LVSKKRFTFTPLPISNSEFLRKSTFGETPAVNPTTVHSISSPVSAMTIDLTLPTASDLISF